MNPFTEEELNKLPKWVRQRIKVLEKNLSAYLKELENFRGEPSKISYPDMSGNKKYIPDDTSVSFSIGEMEIVVSRNTNRKCLEVRCSVDASIRVGSAYENMMRIYAIKGK